MRPTFVPRSFCAAIVMVLLGFCAGSVQAADTPVTLVNVSLGINQHYKSGYWTPIRMAFRGGPQPFRGDVEIVAPDSDGVTTRFVWKNLPPIELQAGETQAVVRLVKLGRTSGPLIIQLRSDDAVVFQRRLSAGELPSPLASEREWIVAYGTDIGVSDALGRKSRMGQNTEVTQLSSPDEFPNHWLGFEAVDTILLTTTDRAKVDALTADQFEALHNWVLMGGRLVWSIGHNGADLLSGNSRLSSLAPGKFHEVATLRTLSALESYSGSVQRIEFIKELPPSIRMTVLSDVKGVLELSETVAGGVRPLIVRAPLGLGQIVFVGFDLELPSVATWEGKARILARVLQPSAGQLERRSGDTSNTQVAQFGYQDMVGQLRSGLDQFPQVRLVALWWVAALVFLYIVLIGPVDYFLLRDVLRRPMLTWITFSLATAAFVAFVLWLGPRWKGDRILINQIDLVDVDAASSSLRGTTWAHVYTPRAATFEMECKLNSTLSAVTELHGNMLAWQGLPGTGLGALNTAAAAPPAIDEYRITTLPAAAATLAKPAVQPMHTVLENVPIHVAATKSLLGRWWGTIQLQGNANLTRDADGLPRGEVVNPLPIELRDCAVYFDNWAFRLDATRGVLAPGQKTRIEIERALNLQWRMTGRRVVDTKDVGTPWDQHTLEVPRILEMMMFHTAAGGASYTQLVNRYQAFVDLSQQLDLQQAVLIGRAATGAAKLRLNDSDVDADQHWTYFRIVFPVAIPSRN